MAFGFAPVIFFFLVLTFLVPYSSWPFTSLANSALLLFFGFSSVLILPRTVYHFSAPVTPQKSLSHALHVISCSGTPILYPLPLAPALLIHLLAFPPSKANVPSLPQIGHLFLNTVLYNL